MTTNSSSASGSGPAETFTPHRPGMEPREIGGPTAYWPDGLTTYTLRWRGGSILWHLADEADTVVGIADALRSGEEISRDRLALALRDTRRLATRLTAVQDELILYARESAPGEDAPRLSWRDIGEELGLHFTTVRERHARAASGDFPGWREWLVQYTERAGLYGGTAPGPTPAGDAPAHQVDVFDHPTLPGRVRPVCTCGWTGEPDNSVVRAARAGKEHAEGADE